MWQPRKLLQAVLRVAKTLGVALWEAKDAIIETGQVKLGPSRTVPATKLGRARPAFRRVHAVAILRRQRDLPNGAKEGFKVIPVSIAKRHPTVSPPRAVAWRGTQMGLGTLLTHHVIPQLHAAFALPHRPRALLPPSKHRQPLPIRSPPTMARGPPVSWPSATTTRCVKYASLIYRAELVQIHSTAMESVSPIIVLWPERASHRRLLIMDVHRRGL